MKKNTNSYLLPMMLLLASGHLIAAIKYNWGPEDESTKIGFNLQNRSDYMIQFQIENESAGAYHKHVLEIEPNSEYGIKLNTNVRTKLRIYQCSEEIPNSCNELSLPTANMIDTTFPLGKTIYIAWDGKELLPQNEGPISDTTTAGYYLTNNVQKTDYTLTETKSADKIYPEEANKDPWDIFPQAKEFAKTLRPAEAYIDATVSKLILGLGGTPTDAQINNAWSELSTQWHPDNHPDEPNFARAVMMLINRAHANLFNPLIKP